jgi:hypothetical protein
LAAFLAAAIWPWVASYFGEFVREFFVYEPLGKILHAAIERISPEWVLRWGPSIVLTALGFYLFHRTKRVPLPKEMPRERAQTTIPPDKRQWLSGYEIWKLADANVLKAAENFEAEARKTQQEIARVENERREFMNRGSTFSGVAGLSELASPAMQEIERRAAEARTKYSATEQQLIAANARIVENLYERLASGKLIAKGFRHPVGSNPDYTEIPPDEWRILRFAVGNKEAEGQGIKYVGISVAIA